jgi:hypothetical protein
MAKFTQIKLVHLPTGRIMVFNSPMDIVEEAIDIRGCLASGHVFEVRRTQTLGHDERVLRIGSDLLKTEETIYNFIPWSISSQCHIELREVEE